MAEIQNFNLFGEQSDLPDVIHCERIETRSLIHDWEFRAHRHGNLHQFLLVESGGGQAQIEERVAALTPGALVNMPAGVVHGFRFQPGTQGWVVTLTRELLDQSLRDGEGLYSPLSHPEIVEFGPEIRSIVTAIFDEYQTRDFARAHVLRGLSGVLAGLVARTLASASAREPRPDHALHRRFLALIETHYREHLGVGEYARRLAVSPTHLSRIARQVTGRPASAAIEERVAREARRNLAFSNLTISEIAYQLGFNDPSYFSRVFTRSTGLSPRAFRAKIQAG